MSHQSGPNNNVNEWLLDPEEPGVLYLAVRDLQGKSADDPQLAEARHEAHTQGPISTVLANMQPEGYWSKPGAGYGPKYYSTVWSISLLAQLGASAHADERINRACKYLLDHTLASGGKLSTNGAPAGTIDCLQGNLLWALLEMGFDDPRIDKAFEWMARTVTGEGMAPRSAKDAEPRYYAYKSGPLFECGANYYQPCAWGATKVMLAFSKLPESRRSNLIKQAIQQGVDFLLGTDPMKAEWPTGEADKPSGNWWKFGFPVFYVTDLLQVAEALVGLGLGNDPRLAGTLEFIRGKQNEDGKWLLEYNYSSKTWVDFGRKKQPNKWVTLRAMRVLKGAAVEEAVG